MKGTPVAHRTRNILAAMKKHGVLRIVAIATASASDPCDVPPLRSRLFVGIAKLFLRPAYDDVVASAQIVRDSDRNWTIVRPPFLKDGPKIGRVNVGYLGDGSPARTSPARTRPTSCSSSFEATSTSGKPDRH